jgi:hypothetical protein
MFQSMSIAQNQIKMKLSIPSNVEYIHNLLVNTKFSNMTALALHLCDYFQFNDLRGQPQHSGCLKALRKLEKDGHIILPTAAIKRPKRSAPGHKKDPITIPKDLPDVVGEIKDLELVLVSTKEQREIWNALMINEHPQGAGPLVGRQLRYLIGSSHGWLGGFGFASAALQLADRDKWIGWNAENRQKYLHFVISMSRFLIRSSVRCQNLASKVLSMSILKVPDDFEQRYGYRPLLVESFVDDSNYLGTCYRATNWTVIGKTKGRGRQDRFKQASLTIKSIYVYPFRDDFRKQLELPSNVGYGMLTPSDGLEGDDWAKNEFGGAPLGDKRLSKRLVEVAKAKAKMPGRSFSGVAKGDWPAVKAYYRFVDQPEQSAVDMTSILAPHRQRTIQRMKGQKTVLCIQDSCKLNFNNLDKCTGLGEIGTNQTGAKAHGLNLHSTFTVTTNGIPLGVLRAECTAPQNKSVEDTRHKHNIPIEEKKTFSWIKHHRDLVELSKQMPQTRLIDIGDREADIFELFDEQRKRPSVDILIRAKQDRRIINNSPEEEDIAPDKLFEAVRQAPIQSRVRICLPRQSARTKKAKQEARLKRIERKVDLTVRAMIVRIRPPKYIVGAEPIDIWVIHAKEDNPPEGAEPVEWFLLTTITINSSSDIEQCLRWYCLRWRIEDWHRVLKSGCKI